MSGASTCPACGADAVENGVCGRCGYAAGETNRCPHCGSVARVEPSGKAPGQTGQWVCAVCGGPRIPQNLGGEDAIAPLREAKAFLGTATRARAASIAWGILAFLATLVVVAATAKEAIAATIVLAALAIVPAILAVRARGRASKAAKSAKSAEERAWLAAAEDAAKSASAKGGGITAKELGKRLQVDEKRADELLTQLAVHERTRIDVGDDAEVRYSVEPQMRVATGGGDALEDEVEEEQEKKLRGRTP